MKEKNKTQKGFVQIPILIAIIVSFVAISGGIYGGFEYYKTSKVIKEAEKLTKEEKYNEVIEKLETAQNNWLVKNLGIKKQIIANEIEKNKKLLEDKTEFAQGIEEFNKENWEKSKESLSKVSEISPNYQEAKAKLEEIQNKIIEKQISEAVKKATEEAKKKTEEAQKKIEEKKQKRIATETQGGAEKLTEETQKKFKTEKTQSSEKITSSEIKSYLTGIGEILCYGFPPSEGSGSLWLFKGPNFKYAVLTNKHVILPSSIGCDFVINDIGIYSLDISKPLQWNSTVDAIVLKIFPSTAPVASRPIPELNYNISSLPFCSKRHHLNSPVVVIGYPAFSEKEVSFGPDDPGGKMSFLTITEGVISAHDTSVRHTENLPDVNYFVSAKIDAGNSGGIALSKNENGQLCVLGISTWLSLGVYETQGIVQSIHNVMYVSP